MLAHVVAGMAFGRPGISSDGVFDKTTFGFDCRILSVRQQFLPKTIDACRVGTRVVFLSAGCVTKYWYVHSNLPLGGNHNPEVALKEVGEVNPDVQQHSNYVFHIELDGNRLPDRIT